MSVALLEVRDLSIGLRGQPGRNVVRGVSFEVRRGEVLAVVGESGCGKSVTSLAIACRPDLIIADEPTTALDPTIQAQIMALLAALRDELGVAIILITHNLGLVAQVADRVLVMYAGRKVEEAAAGPLFAHPLHPYTRRLLVATPRPGIGLERLAEIPGLVPSVLDLPPGCAFAPRCPMAVARCGMERPSLRRLEGGREVACLRRLRVVAAYGPAGVSSG